MQYKPETEKAAMINTAYIPVIQPLSPSQDPQIQRIRKIFMIILGVLLAIVLMNLIVVIVGYGLANSKVNIQLGPQIGQNLVGILMYGFGLFAAYKYSTLGLRIFAWLGIISLVCTGIVFVILVFVAIVGVAAAGFIVGTQSANAGLGTDTTTDAGAGSGSVLPASLIIGAGIGGLVFVIVLVAAFVLSIIIVKIAFQLARLIDAHQRLIIQQI